MTTNRAKDLLQGSVKEFFARTMSVSEKNGDVLEEFQSLQFSRYDKAGNKVEEAHYNSNDSLLFKITYTYDLAGKLVEQVNFDADESPLFKTTYEYDFNERLIEQKTFASDGSLQSTLRPVYTAEGLRIEEETLPLFEESGDTSCFVHIEETNMGFTARGGDKIRKIYDRKGKPIEATVRSSKGKRMGKVLFAYDADGRLIEVSNYGSNGFYPCGERTKWQRILEPLTLRLIKIFLLLKCVYSFGIKGELKKAARCFAYGPLVMSTLFVYDDRERIVEEQTLFFGSLEMKKVFAYDEKGNKSEEIEYVGNSSVLQKQSYRREYDFQGNWVKETVFCQFRMEEKHEQTTVVTHRTISYYSS